MIRNLEGMRKRGEEEKRGRGKEEKRKRGKDGKGEMAKKRQRRKEKEGTSWEEVRRVAADSGRWEGAVTALTGTRRKEH